jgi:hypothetical protein
MTTTTSFAKRLTTISQTSAQPNRAGHAEGAQTDSSAWGEATTSQESMTSQTGQDGGRSSRDATAVRARGVGRHRVGPNRLAFFDEFFMKNPLFACRLNSCGEDIQGDVFFFLFQATTEIYAAPTRRQFFFGNGGFFPASAIQFCADNGGIAASIRTANEGIAARNRRTGSSGSAGIFVGLRRTSLSSPYSWVDGWNGAQPWSSGEPQNDEHMAAYWSRTTLDDFARSLYVVACGWVFVWV